MTARSAADVVMALLHAIETRALDRVHEFYHPEVAFYWPPGLPYSGEFTGAALDDMNARFAATWLPLQPTDESRKLDARVVATGDDGRVVVHYDWKGQAPDGRRFHTETLADYQVRDQRLARAQMFYYDLRGLIAFLEHARAGGVRA